jgi:hypothetical protein
MQGFEYSLSVVDSLTHLALPLLKRFGAKNLAFCKVFKDGKRMYLSASEDWIKLYCSQNFQDNESHLSHYVPKTDMPYSLWAGFEEDDIVSACYDINHYHGFSVHTKGEDCYEYLDINTTKDDYHLPNRCLNNLEELTAHIDSFRKNAVFILNHQDHTRLIHSKIWEPFEVVKKSASFYENGNLNGLEKKSLPF